jgi:putative ABC transport system permease protein
MVDLALKSLLYDKLRFLITVSGVAFAVTSILVQVGLFTGLLDNSTVTIRHADAELWITSKNTPNVDFAHAFPDSYVQRVRSVSGVARADNLVIAFIPMSLPSAPKRRPSSTRSTTFAAGTCRGTWSRATWTIFAAAAT